MLAQAYSDLAHWLRRQFFIQKLNTPLGFGLLGLLAIALGYVIATVGLKVGAILWVLIIGLPMLGACVFFPIVGISLSLFIAIFVGFITKYVEAPFGMALDGLLFLLFFGLLVQQIKVRDFSWAKNPVSAVILVWVFYNFIQVLNPEAGSRLAWLFTVRTMAGLILLFFIASNALDSLKKIKFILKLILFIGFLSALYALKQEFIGFSNAEMAWLRADEERYQLIVQWSRTRVFSFFSDPTTFGIYMSYMSLMALIFMLGPIQMWKRVILGIALICMLMSMAFAGSRTPFVLFPFGLFIFTLLTMKKEIIIAMAVCGVIGMGFMLKSTSNAVVYRIQSAFMSDKSDDTMQVRYKNQKRMRPYVYSHPFGAGLGSSGIWGKRFTPNSWLASFAHDSAFVRIAVELGYIGLFIFAAFLLTIIRFGLYYYLRVKDPFIKTVYLSILVTIFVLTLASYPQEAIPILPTSIVFYTLLGVMVRIKDFDPNFQESSSSDLSST